MLTFCVAYIFGRTSPLPLTIPGIKTPLYCRVHDSDIRVLWQIFGERWFELDDIAPPEFIVDGGAYIGYTSLFFATKFPNATIVAIEPNPANHALFERNCAAYPNIRLVKAAVWDSDAPLVIENPDDDSWMLRVAPDNSAESPSLLGVNLASILQESDFDTIDLLKLDIEGAEKVVFGRNYAWWLNRTRNMMVELHERYTPGCEEIFFQAIANQPFERDEVGEYTVLTRPKIWQSADDKPVEPESTTHHLPERIIAYAQSPT